MTKLTDFHTHILPEMDDGAEDIDESITMLRELASQGIERVVLTPHYYSQYKPAFPDYITLRQKQFEFLCAHPDIPPEIELILSAEVRLHDALLLRTPDELRKLCLPGTDYLLLEFPYGEKISSHWAGKVRKVIYDYDVIPILAHIERFLHRIDSKTLDTLFEDGCKAQINLNSWEKVPFLQRRRLAKYIQNGQVICCGTDCHNMLSRPPLYADSAAKLTETFGHDTADSILTASEIF